MKRLSLAFVAALTLSACGKADLPRPNPVAMSEMMASTQPAEQDVETKLFDLWEEEVKAGGAAYVEALNERTLRALETARPANGAKPFGEFQASVAHRALDTNIVTSDRTKYEQPGTAIGYCFGRAMFVHLYALHNHYKKAQIRKIWAVGSMKTSYHNWAFHVATMVQDGATGEWRVVDSFMRNPVTPRAWFKVFQGQNQADRDLRVYVTPAEKFAPDLGKYSRDQLGLDLSPGEDWYKHYFTDMMETLKIRKEIGQ
jgi:hypothetical protein